MRRYRNRHGGGVLFYIKDKWTVSDIQINSNLEMISLDIRLLNSPIMKFGVVYRQYNSKSDWIDRFDV